MVAPDDCLWGKDFYNTYMKHARRKSYNNDILHKAGVLSLVGQSLRDVYLRIDQQHIGCRIHPFVIQSSGTGKGSVFSLIGTIASASGIPFDEEGTATTAGLMGTVRRNGETIKGDIAGSGFVAWKEAQTLLKSADQTHSSDILEVLNMAMDPSGKVEKTLSGGKLEYSSNTSVFCTTYDPEPSGQLELIRQGFLPRTLFFYRTLGDEFYDEINRMRDSKVPTVENSNNEDYKWEMENDVEKLANTLKYIEDTVWEHGKVMSKADSHYAVAQNHIDYFKGLETNVSLNPSPMMNEVLEEYPYSIRKMAAPFKTRMMNKVYRIAACLAATDYDEKRDVYVSRWIKERHVKIAKDICRKSFKMTLDFVYDYSVDGSSSELRTLEQKVRTISRNNGGSASVKELMSETYRNRQGIKRDLSTLAEMDKIEATNGIITALELEDRVRPLH
jgi:hypothetical protein